MVSWEWRDGIRSWLFPDFLAGIMSLSGYLGFGPDGYLPFIAAILSLVALGPVVIGILLGWRHSGLVGGALCGVLGCFWPDLVYFAPKTLAEIQAGTVLAIAAGLASLSPPEWETTHDVRRFPYRLAIGALLGVAFCLRFQLSPALLLVGAWAGRKDFRNGWLPLALGAAAPLLALGVSDYLSWGSPFQSIWKNIYVNIVVNRSAAYGVAPPLWFVSKLMEVWGYALLPILVFFALGARAAPLMALTAVVTLLFHSLIAHKEISFIYAAAPLAMTVVGIGTARSVLALHRLRPDVSLRSALALAVVLWTILAGSYGVAGLRALREEVASSMLPVWMAAAKAPDLCGLGLYGPHFPWYRSGGYSYLNRATPIYLLRTPEALAEAQPGINYVLVDSRSADTLPEYKKALCSSAFCLLKREQPCAEMPKFRINGVLAEEGA